MAFPCVPVFQQVGFNNIKTFVEEELQSSMVSVFLKILCLEIDLWRESLLNMNDCCLLYAYL